MTKLNNI